MNEAPARPIGFTSTDGLLVLMVLIWGVNYVLLNTIYQFAFIEGLAHTRVGNAALIMAAVPVQTAVISHFRGHDRLRGRDVAGFLLSFAGIAAVVLGSATAQLGASSLGDLLV